MSDALHKAQEAAGDAKERFDFVSQKEFDGLRDAVDRLREEVSALEARFRGDADTGWNATSAAPDPDAEEDDQDFADKADPGPSH
jgi:hypothetical protein